MAIPDQLPVEYYVQRNVYPKSVCKDSSSNILDINGGLVASTDELPAYCESSSDCGESTETCVTNAECVTKGFANGECSDDNVCYNSCGDSSSEDLRLAFDAGSCDATESGVGNGGECKVGQCSEDGSFCTDDGDCDEQCVYGYCVATGTSGCVDSNESGVCSCDYAENASDGTNTNCDSATVGGDSTPYCSFSGECVSINADDADVDDSCVSSSECTLSAAICVQTATASTGGCYNNRCLTDVRDGGDSDSLADALDVDYARSVECRGYPEIDSPFPSEVVESWQAYSGTDIEADADHNGAGDEMSGVTFGTTDEGNLELWSTPYSYMNGFQDATICGVDQETGEVVDCLCSYDKFVYGDGAANRYYELNTGIGAGAVPQGICSGGPIRGIPCVDNLDCSDGSSEGTCMLLSEVKGYHGWAGYCLEEDTSINVNADQNQQACLSWLPVDQLAGATDLYAKYTSAGFAPQENFYCGEIGLAVDIGTTAGLVCAEPQDYVNGCKDSSWEKFLDNATEDFPGFFPYSPLTALDLGFVSYFSHLT